MDVHGPSTETVAMPRVQCAETVRLNPPAASKLRLEHSPSTCSEPPHRPQSPPLRPPERAQAVRWVSAMRPSSS